MPRRNSTVEIVDGKVVFSQEVLSYFESIRTEENSVWIDKYFEYLGDESNLSAIKYNLHHIRPCCSFKDNEHKNRKETLPLGDKFKGNIIKLSIYNHLLAHYCLWKIYDNWDSELHTTLKSGGFFFLLHRQCLQSQATNARQCRGIRLHRGLFQPLSSFSRTKQFYIFRSMNISVT